MQSAGIKPELLAIIPDDWTRPAEPQVADWLRWAWRAWHRLSFDRPIHGGGMGPPVPGRIPWRAVVEWADYHDQDAEFLDRAVLALDEVYLTWCAKQREATKRG